MKRVLALIVVLAMVLAVVPAVFAETITVSLGEGSTPVPMVPGNSYKLSYTLTDKTDYYLTWSEGITVLDRNDNAVHAPVEISKYATRFTLLKATVATETDAVFTVTYMGEAKPIALELGPNEVEVTDAAKGVAVEVSAEGFFTLSADTEETNAKVIVADETGAAAAVELPYDFYVEETPQVLTITTLDEKADKVNLVLTERKTETLVEGENSRTLEPYTRYTLKVDMGEREENAGTLEWGEGVTVTVNAVTQHSPYDLSGYGPKVELVATVEEKINANFVVTLPALEVLPQLVLGDNAVNVTDGSNGDKVAFTAEETGTYILSAAEGEENQYMFLLTADGSESIDLPYEFELEAGKTIKFVVATDNIQPDVIDLFLEKKPNEELLWLYEGDNETTLVPGTNYTLKVDLGSRDEFIGTLEWPESVTVKANDEEITSPYDLSNYNPHTWLVATVQEETPVNFVVTLPEEEPAFPLKLGENAVAVPSGYEGVEAEYTAAETGAYVIYPAEGEENAFVSVVEANSSEQIDLPYEFDLAAGETVTFSVAPNDSQEDTINLILEKKLPEETIELNVGDNIKDLVPGTDYVLKLILGDEFENEGTLTWPDNVKVREDGLFVASPYDLGDMADDTVLTARVEEAAEVNLEITLPVIHHLVLGGNTVSVIEGYDGDKTKFTAEQAGSYVLMAGEGEENAYMMLETDTGSESIDLPYAFMLNAGETITFLTATYSGDPDDIDLYLCSHVDKTMETVTEGVEPGDHSYGIKALSRCPDCGTVFDDAGEFVTAENLEAVILLPLHFDTMEHVDEVKASTAAEGMEEHVYCSACDDYTQEDSEAVDAVDVANILKKVTKQELIIPKSETPVTGDAFMLIAVIVLLVLSTAGIVTTIVLKKKKTAR